MTIPRPAALLPEHQENTQAARVARRRAFRRSFELSRDARAYVPAPYINHEPPAEHHDDGDLTWHNDPGQAERAGDHIADPP